MTDPADPALADRMQDPAFARAYDVWLVVLTQQAAAIELARSGSGIHRPRRAQRRTRTTGENHTVPRTA